MSRALWIPGLSAAAQAYASESTCTIPEPDAISRKQVKAFHALVVLVYPGTSSAARVEFLGAHSSSTDEGLSKAERHVARSEESLSSISHPVRSLRANGSSGLADKGRDCLIGHGR